MPEVVLPYDRAIAPQETGYWCAPASTQMVLNSRGIFRNEPDLARRMGTHTGGTDHIGLPARVLNEELGGGYVVRLMPQDPPLAYQKAVLWEDIRRSVNAGYGLVVNIVVPPSNYPRGIKGSISPAYAGGTVYHYIAVMGYDDEYPGGAVWIADSGFRPFGYWMSLEQLASAIPPKGYAAKPVGDLVKDERGTQFQNSWGHVVDKKTFMEYADRRLISAEAQFTTRYPQLGGYTLLGAISRILKEIEERGSNGR